MSVFPISFLVALLLQVGFGYSAFEAGQLTCWFTAGAFMMRANVTNIVRAVGLRNLLVVCSMTTATMSVGFTFFTPETSRIFIAAYLFLFGMLRNAQHQSVSALAYSEIPNEDVSKSTTIASLVQRGCQSFGVAMAASLLALFAGDAEIAADDFKPVFIVMALITATAMLGFMLLRPNDGWEISGHKVKPKETKEEGD